jgi:NAD(P)-dependent dehydrogenase (short-subunit alcohol dehydrogenase family)
MADYSPVKHAVIVLMETLRADLDMAGARSIGTTVLCPAIVDTSMGRRAMGLISDSDPNDDRKIIGSGPDLSSILAPDITGHDQGDRGKPVRCSSNTRI